MYFYSDTKTGPAPQINVWKLNGTSGYLRHYENYLFLHFVAKNERSTWQEKAQARKELTICEQKLAWWSKHPNYDHDEAVRGVEQLKRMWNAKAAA